MSPFTHIKHKLTQATTFTIGFKSFIYISFAMVWFVLALRS